MEPIKPYHVLSKFCFYLGNNLFKWLYKTKDSTSLFACWWHFFTWRLPSGRVHIIIIVWQTTIFGLTACRSLLECTITTFFVLRDFMHNRFKKVQVYLMSPNPQIIFSQLQRRNHRAKFGRPLLCSCNSVIRAHCAPTRKMLLIPFYTCLGRWCLWRDLIGMSVSATSAFRSLLINAETKVLVAQELMFGYGFCKVWLLFHYDAKLNKVVVSLCTFVTLYAVQQRSSNYGSQARFGTWSHFIWPAKSHYQQCKNNVIMKSLLIWQNATYPETMTLHNATWMSVGWVSVTVLQAGLTLADMLPHANLMSLLILGTSYTPSEAIFSHC